MQNQPNFSQIALTSLVTVLIVIVVLAFVPGSKRIYTWLNPGNDFCLGVSGNFSNNNALKVSQAISKFLEAYVSMSCKGDKDKIATSLNKVPPKICKASFINGVKEGFSNGVYSSQMAEIGVDVQPVISAFGDLITSLEEAVCLDNSFSVTNAINLVNNFGASMC